MPYMLVYPGGNRRRVAVCYVQDYEKRDWDLAGRQEFETAEECQEYGERLIEDTNLSPTWRHAFLD